MMSLSQTTGYAALALSCLDSTGSKPIRAQQIAACSGIPHAYLAKVLRSLARSNLIESKRGYRGGFTLRRPSCEISLLDVAVAVEGANWMPPCIWGLFDCTTERACPMAGFWTKQREEIEQELRRVTVADLTAFASSCACRAGACDCLGAASDQSREVDTGLEEGCCSDAAPRRPEPAKRINVRNTRPAIRTSRSRTTR